MLSLLHQSQIDVIQRSRDVAVGVVQVLSAAFLATTSLWCGMKGSWYWSHLAWCLVSCARELSLNLYVLNLLDVALYRAHLLSKAQLLLSSHILLHIRLCHPIMLRHLRHFLICICLLRLVIRLDCELLTLLLLLKDWIQLIYLQQLIRCALKLRDFHVLRIDVVLMSLLYRHVFHLVEIHKILSASILRLYHEIWAWHDWYIVVSDGVFLVVIRTVNIIIRTVIWLYVLTRLLRLRRLKFIECHRLFLRRSHVRSCIGLSILVLQHLLIKSAQFQTQNLRYFLNVLGQWWSVRILGVWDWTSLSIEIHLIWLQLQFYVLRGLCFWDFWTCSHWRSRTG